MCVFLILYLQHLCVCVRANMCLPITFTREREKGEVEGDFGEGALDAANVVKTFVAAKTKYEVSPKFAQLKHFCVYSGP